MQKVKHNRALPAKNKFQMSELTMLVWSEVKLKMMDRIMDDGLSITTENNNAYLT